MKILYITCKDEKEAENISKECISNNLAACGNTFPISSIYKWNSKIQSNKEYVLILKTQENKLRELKEKVKELHSYEVPCILEFDVKANQEYDTWVKSCLESQK